MTSVKQSVLDGTSKWSAKIAITGLWAARARRSYTWSCTPYPICDRASIMVLVLYKIHTYIYVPRTPTHFNPYSETLLSPYVPAYICASTHDYIFLFLLLLLSYHQIWRYKWLRWLSRAMLYRLSWIYQRCIMITFHATIVERGSTIVR